MHKLYDFMEARERLATIAVKTKLIHSSVYSQETGNDVYIKPENLQRTGSFKLRGAYNKISKLTEAEKACGVIAASAGNHAQGVALAAQRLGIKAVIVMPRHTPLIKVEATRQYGAEVVLAGEVYDEAYEKACELQEKHGYVFVHPFDDEEILEELPNADIILVPGGGGGLISGVAAAAKLKNPQVKIIGVEPEGAASARAAVEEGKPVALPSVSTIADGAAVKLIGSKNLEYIQNYVDEIVTVSDYELMEGKTVVSILSGGNIDVLTIASMITKGLVVRGRIFTFAVNLSDKPGQLVAVSEILAEQNANVIKLEHNQFKNLDRFHEVELVVTVETNGEDHIKKITAAMADRGYTIHRISSNEFNEHD